MRNFHAAPLETSSVMAAEKQTAGAFHLGLSHLKLLQLGNKGANEIDMG